MGYYLAPIGNESQTATSGAPLSGGKIYTYAAGTNTPKATYTDNSSGVQQNNPIILNTYGLPPSPIWMLGGQMLKFVFQDSAGNLIRTIDFVAGENDPTFAASATFLSGVAGTNALTASLAGFSAYAQGQSYTFIPPNTNTGAVTININGVGPVAITKKGTTALAPGDLIANAEHVINYDGAQFQLINIGGLAQSGNNTDITSLGNNTSTIYTTGGTSTAYTITPTPAITAYAAGQSFMVNFNAASGASPTLQISGVASPPSLVKENADGTYSNIAANDIPANHRGQVKLISTTQALVEGLALPTAATPQISADYTGAAGTSLQYARADHKHPGNPSRSWQDVKASRPLATNFTGPNYEIEVYFRGNSASAATAAVQVTVGGLVLGLSSGAGGTGDGGFAYFKVPPNAVYRIDNSAGTQNVATWNEYR